MRAIAVVNEKGGVGKTTTVITVAHGLALRGQRVLLIDFDSQGSASIALGLDPLPDTRRLLLAGELLPRPVTEARPGLHLIRSDDTLSDVDA